VTCESCFELGVQNLRSVFKTVNLVKTVKMVNVAARFLWWRVILHVGLLLIVGVVSMSFRTKLRAVKNLVSISTSLQCVRIVQARFFGR
jgi:hypothetical protein